MDDQKITPPADPPEISRDTERNMSRLEADLAALTSGTSVIIERLQPSWCKGKLEKFTVSDELGLDLQYLIDTWGGHLLSIKVMGDKGRIHGSTLVELYSFDPRRYGKKLKQPSRFHDDDDEEAGPSMAIVQSSPAQKNDDSMMKMFEFMERQRQSEIETLRAIMAMQAQQISANSNPNQTGIAELIKMARGFGQLKELFKDDSAPAMGDDFSSQIMGLVSALFQNRQQEPKANITAPSKVQPSPMAAPVPSPPQQTRTRIAPVPNPTDTDIVSQFSKMSPEDAATTLLEALHRMPEDKKPKVIEAVWNEFSEVMGYEEEEEDEEGVGTR